MLFTDRVMSVDGAARKIVLDYPVLYRRVNTLRTLGAHVVLTIGSWDMLHVGHVRYLTRARGFGDILVVGVDSDEAVKKYKGPDRPVIPLQERQEMLSYLACVDLITSVADVDGCGKWQYELVKLLKPDVFVAVEDSYPEDQRQVIREHCNDLIILPRQAENTSSSNIIQKTIKANIKEVRALGETHE